MEYCMGGEFKTIRNIILDMDGTLVNTAKITVPSCQEAARKFGFTEKNSETISLLIGWPGLEFYKRLYPEASYSNIIKYAEEVEVLEKQYIKKLGRDFLYNGVWDLLMNLKSEGCFLALASTGDTAHVETSLSSTGLYPFFDILKYDHADKPKMVKEIVDFRETGEFLILGDRFFDARAGKENHIRTVHAGYGFGSIDEGNEFDVVVNDPSDLLTLLGI